MGDWVLSMAGSAAGAAAMLALVGFLFRSQLLHFLNKDLEAVKARYQRELEAYKVSLIAETERTKANLDVRKAMAIRIADAKFSAIHALHEVGHSLGANALSGVRVYAEAEIDLRHVQRDSLMECVSKASSAVDLASPFLAAHELAAYREFYVSLSNLIDRLSPEVVSLTTDEFTALKASITQQQNLCSSYVKSHLSSMLDMK